MTFANGYLNSTNLQDTDPMIGRDTDKGIQRNAQSVRVIHGSNEGFFNVAGFSIEAIRDQLADAFNLRSCDVCYVNGEEVDWTFLLTGGDCLEFNKRGGQKGLTELLTPEELRNRWNITLDEYRELQGLGLPTVPFHNGTVRHPEVAIDKWMASLGGNHSSDKQTIQQSEWINSASAMPPITHQFGPLIGNQEQLSSWLHPHQKSDPRHLKGRAERGVIWV